jgi:hypothetical protein
VPASPPDEPSSPQPTNVSINAAIIAVTIVNKFFMLFLSFLGTVVRDGAITQSRRLRMLVL